MKCKKYSLWLIIILFLFGLLSAGCVNSGGGSESADEIKELVGEITKEIVHGQMERTAQALEEKVFVHVSGDYDYAGQDKDQMMENSLEELENNPDLSITKYDFTVEVIVGEDRQSATSMVNNNIQGVYKANEEISFDAEVSGKLRSTLKFVKDPDDQWRVIASQANYNETEVHGGSETQAVDLSDVELDVTQLSGGGKISLTGNVDLPLLADGQKIFMSVSMDWGDDRNNAQLWYFAEESVIYEELTDHEGEAYALNLTLPDDGEPGGIVLPDKLPIGTDAVSVSVNLSVQDSGDESAWLRADGRHFSIPFIPLENEQVCIEEIDDDIDGLWTLELTDDTYGVFNFLMLSDLRRVNDQLYGVVMYGTTDNLGADAPVMVEVTGEISDNSASFSYVADGLTLSFEATLSGTEMIDGTATYEVGLGDVYEIPFTGKKLDNRCVGVEHDLLDGKNVAVSFDGGVPASYLVTADGAEVTLTGGGNVYDGLLIRNGFLAFDGTDSGNWLMLGFYDLEQGWAAQHGDPEAEQGTFIIQ